TVGGWTRMSRATSGRARPRRSWCSSVQGVEVVVHRDAADTHRVGDIFHRSTQSERSTLVEQANGPLLVFTAQRRQRGAELALNGVDQPIEGAVQRRHAHRGDDRTLPAQRHVAGFAFLGGHQRCTERLDNRFYRQHERMARKATHRVSGRRSVCRLTWVAPWANAASSTARATSPAFPAGTLQLEPNGPK